MEKLLQAQRSPDHKRDFCCPKNYHMGEKKETQRKASSFQEEMKLKNGLQAL